MAWTTLTLQVTTPLFNGGADPDGAVGFRPDQESGIRVASIRGAMRFWFRALAGCVTGPDLNLLSSLERRVFGSTDASSPVILRIPAPPPVVMPNGPHRFLPPPTAQLNERRRDCSRWIIYLMGQGLGDLAQCVVRRPYVEPGRQFDLKIRFRHQPSEDSDAAMAVESLALASLWLTCAYGGVGARARRGFGGLRIIGTQGPLPGPWNDSAAVLTPGLSHYATLAALWPAGAVASCMPFISVLAGRRFDARAAWAAGPPSFPVLSRTHAPAAVSGGDAFLNWADTLIHAGEQFRHFRANRPNPNARYRPAVETYEWANVVHGQSDHFDLGALGLPIVYRDGYVVNVDRQDSERPLRRASPLWLRAVGDRDQWRLLSFAFCGEFLPGPDAAGIHLWHNGVRSQHLQVTSRDVAGLTDQWISALRDDKSFVDEISRS
jgi:hypothetical protein